MLKVILTLLDIATQTRVHVISVESP